MRSSSSKESPLLRIRSAEFAGTLCYTVYMFSDLSDTSPEIEALQLKLLRQASPARKLELLAQMNATVKTLALSGLSARHPDDPPEIIQRRLADLILGEETAQKVYGHAPYAT
jgi:hypothetical protein